MDVKPSQNSEYKQTPDAAVIIITIIYPSSNKAIQPQKAHRPWPDIVAYTNKAHLLKR
jgi:hypothetical protein